MREFVRRGADGLWHVRKETLQIAAMNRAIAEQWPARAEEPWRRQLREAVQIAAMNRAIAEAQWPARKLISAEAMRWRELMWMSRQLGFADQQMRRAEAKGQMTTARLEIRRECARELRRRIEAEMTAIRNGPTPPQTER